jgi:hypothetical protein
MRVTLTAIAEREICIVADFRLRIPEHAAFGDADVSERLVRALKPGERKGRLKA